MTKKTLKVCSNFKKNCKIKKDKSSSNHHNNK